MTLCFVSGRKQGEGWDAGVVYGQHHLGVRFTHGVKGWDASRQPGYQASGPGNV